MYLSALKLLDGHLGEGKRQAGDAEHNLSHGEQDVLRQEPEHVDRIVRQNCLDENFDLKG